MFYSQFILAKKGPLGTIWIAAHLERKLRKNQVADTDIGVSVDSILFPEVPIALRLSSHLLLGVVRIYSRKVNYLFDDCSETLLKVKQAFRSAAVDLPPEESTAPYHSITLPETFDLDDFELPDNDIFQSNYVDRHVSTKEQITLQDTMEGMIDTNSQFGLDERFGDGDASQIGLDLDEVMLIDKDITLEHDDLSANPQVSLPEDEKEEEVMIINEEATLEHDGFSANPQVSHQEDEKKKEVMLIDEDATLEHDGFSANPQVSHQEGEKEEEVRATSDRMQVEDSGIKIDLISGLPTADEVNEYAQGPSTPGLEEPNLIVTQLNQVNNEPDYHNNSADLVAMETTEKETFAHQAENDVIDCSVQDDRKHVVVDMHHEASDHLLVEVDSKREEQEHLACTVVMKDQENLIPTDRCLESVTLMDSSDKDQPTNLIPECAGGTFDASDIPQMVEDLHDRVLMNNVPVEAPLNHPLNAVAGGGSVNQAVASPTRLHVTSDQDDHSCKLLPNMDGSRGSEFDGHMEDGNTLSNHDVLNNNDLSKSGEQPHAIYEAPISNILSPQGSPGRPEIVDVEAQASLELKEADALKHVPHETEQPTESHLRPCTSHLSHPSLSSIEGKNCHETDVSNPTLGHCDTVEPSACEGKLDLGKSDMQFRNQTFSNEVESINKSAASDLPQPEKMLSLAYEHNREANDFLVGSTPDNQGISEAQTADAGTKYTSGKKRSYAESILTVQNVDSVGSYGGAQSKQTDSYGGAQSKRTAESIPHDDDLLSSILAGRSSSVLKIKPSPAVPETVSTKRRRYAPRTSSALKRKVFMDDMMVLHGDTIRQQLTNTADIRRVRKKAPCTRHEILMIQRQFLEDEIFREPIFTGLTTNLTILRNETFDLSGIKVCDYGLDEPLIEKTNDQESYSRTNIEIHGGEVNNEPMAVQPQEDAEAQPTEMPDLSYSRANIEIHGVEANDEPMAVQPQEDAEAQPTEMPDPSYSRENIEIHGVEANDEPMAVQPQEDAEAQRTEMPDPSYSRTNIEIHGVEANNEPMVVQLQGDAVAQTTEIPDLSYSRTNIQMHGVEANNEPVAIQPQENAEAQPTEMPDLSQSHQSEVNLGSHNLDAHGDTSLISQGKELDISQTVKMNITGGNIQISESENCSVGPGNESSSLPEVFENYLCTPNDFDASSPPMDKMNDLVGSIHTNVSSIPTSQNSNTFPILEHELLEGRDRIEVDTIPENTMEIRTEVRTDGLETNDLCASLATASKEANEYIDNGGLPIEENGNSVPGGLNEDQIVSFGLGCDDKDAESGGLFSENTKVECLHSLAPADEKKSSLNDEENRVCQEAAFEGSMCADGSAIMSPFVDQNNENETDAINTEFLNVGDDEIIDDEDDGDFAPSTTGSHFENSGWSSRTRNVAKYLQISFHKEDLHGNQGLHLENILAGKTRKEASRMFFETLVLKTKDYVHVEQTKPFTDINIKPRMKLMKSDF